MIQTIPSAGQYGVVRDALPQELPVNAWSDAANVRFRDGYAERFGGTSPVFATPSITPYAIFPYRQANNKYWIHMGLAGAYVDDGSTRTNISPTVAFTGAIADRWTGGSASGVMVVNNGVDQPHFWGGNTANKFAILTGWNSAWRCASISPFKNYLVALDITKSGTRYANMVKWSAASVPGAIPTSWDETDATKDAGEQDLAETTDVFVDQLQLGDVNVLYKERSMYGMQYIGAPFIFRFYRMPGNWGLLARGCAVDTPNGHVILAAGDLMIHNGQGPKSIINSRMRRWLFNSIDTVNFAQSFLTINENRNEVWVCFPENGQSSCTKALVWNFQDDTFAVRALNNVTYGASGNVLINTNATWAADSATWASDTTTWDNDGYGSAENRLLLTSTAPSITVAEGGTAFDGASTTTCYLERTGLAFDQPEMIKTVRSVIPRIEAAAGTVLTVQVGAAMDAEGSTTWSNPVTYTVGTTRKVDSFATGRFLAIRFQSTANASWRLKSYDMELQVHGRY